MDYTTLGRTGLKVSVAGLGCGGSSRLGLGYGNSEAQGAEVVRAALDQGVNLLDTAAAYGTEGVVGMALKGVPRDGVVVSTKSRVDDKGELITPEALQKSLDNSLRVLGLNHVDVFHLHAVSPKLYAGAKEQLVPVLLRAREAGKIRHLGITETAPNDHGHVMLERSTQDGIFEVVMVAFHMMCQNARGNVFPHTREHGIGTLLMFAVRAIFSVPGYLEEITRGLIAEGRLPADIDPADPLAFLIHEGGASSLTDAAYRYARHEPGVDVVLFGTGKPKHVKDNVAAILRPPLPAADVAKLNTVFGKLVGVGLDIPKRG